MLRTRPRSGQARPVEKDEWASGGVGLAAWCGGEFGEDLEMGLGVAWPSETSGVARCPRRCPWRASPSFLPSKPHALLRLSSTHHSPSQPPREQRPDNRPRQVSRTIQPLSLCTMPCSHHPCTYTLSRQHRPVVSPCPSCSSLSPGCDLPLFFSPQCLSFHATTLSVSNASSFDRFIPSPSLTVTSSVTYCAPPESLLIEQFDIAYFAKNESIVFNISAASVVRIQPCLESFQASHLLS